MAGIDWATRVKAALPDLAVRDGEKALNVFEKLVDEGRTERDYVMIVGACAFFTAQRMRELHPAPAGGFYGVHQSGGESSELSPQLNAFRVLAATLNEDADMAIAISVMMFRANDQVASEFLGCVGANLSLMLAYGSLGGCTDPTCRNREAHS